MISQDALRHDVEYHWPTYKFGDGLARSICEQYARTSPEMLADAIRRHRAEDFDAARPNWKRIGTLVANGRATTESSDNYWDHQVAFLSGGPGSPYAGCTEEQMVVAWLKTIPTEHGDACLRGECRMLRDALREKQVPIPDWIMERLSQPPKHGPENDGG